MMAATAAAALLPGTDCRTPLQSSLHSATPIPVKSWKPTPARSHGIHARLVADKPPPSYKVAVLGAGGDVGRHLALLIKMSPFVGALNLYDTRSACRAVAESLSHCNTPCRVSDFSGRVNGDGLPGCLDGADVVVVVSKSAVKPGMTHEDIFATDAGAVKTWVAAVADCCPEALVHIISNSINSTVPIAAEILKRKEVYNPKKLFGVTTLDVVRASTFVARKKGLRVVDVSVPVVGGHEGPTALPLLSKARPRAGFTASEAADVTERVRGAEAEVVDLKGGYGTAALSTAYAGARFVESCLRGLGGEEGVRECAFVESDAVAGVPFFASRVWLGKGGAEAVVGEDLEGLTEFEEEELEELKPVLLRSIERGLVVASAYTLHF